MDLNDALRTYLGSDAQGGVRPYGMEERIQAKFGVSAPEVLKEVRCALEGLLEPHEGTNLASIQDISGLVEQRVRARNPHLQDDVCRAIGNYAAYSYR